MSPGPTIVIRLVNGQVQVEGPLDNTMLCYGMLEAARDAIKAYRDTKAQSAIVAPNPADVEAIRRPM